MHFDVVLNNRVAVCMWHVRLFTLFSKLLSSSLIHNNNNNNNNNNNKKKRH